MQQVGKKASLNYEVLQDAKERGGLGLPDLKLYFSSCYLVWMKVWILLRNRRFLDLERCGLRFGWHEYPWYSKCKINVDFFKNIQTGHGENMEQI